MNNEKTDDEVRDRAPLLWRIGVCAVVGGVAMYVWLIVSGAGFKDPPKRFELFASLGDAMAPFAAILSATALFAAIDSVRLQRIEFKKGLEFMREQADAAKQTAEVQTRLADAQDALAKRQHEANLAAYHAQVATLAGACTKLDVRIAEVRLGDNPNRVDLAAQLETLRNRSVHQLNYYVDVTRGVLGIMPLHGVVDQDSAGQVAITDRKPPEDA